jgi:imidazolonepropionase-like amidohydrolase
MAMLKKAGTWIMPSLVVADFYMGRDPSPDDPRMASVPLSVRAKWSEGDFRRAQQSEDDKRKAAEGVKIEYDVFRRAAAAGVRFLAGSDAGYINPYIFHGYSIHDELERYVLNGLSPHAALATATVNPAIYLGQADMDGRIAENRLADLVLLNGNPLEEIANTRKIEAVIANGRLFDRPQLDQITADVRRRAVEKPK